MNYIHRLGFAGKLYLSALALDLPRYVLHIITGNWLCIRNRGDDLEPAPLRSGYRCKWIWTNELRAVKILPFLGTWLFSHAIKRHPVSIGVAEPMTGSMPPNVTFIIGHRGLERIKHLLLTLNSIAAQTHLHLECIVVEQDVACHLKGVLPLWVRLIHTPLADASLPYCRSWAFNVGAHYARGTILIFHDNDILVPRDYASVITRIVDDGYDVVNAKRYIFYLDASSTAGLREDSLAMKGIGLQTILQNAEGGGSIAITSDGFEKIGGFDEAFIGWGGEDNEFWERAQLLRVWYWGMLPLIHMWHGDQPGKYHSGTPTKHRYQLLQSIDRCKRAADLRNKTRGQLSGPNPSDPPVKTL
jgi:hypothetical protein